MKKFAISAVKKAEEDLINLITKSSKEKAARKVAIRFGKEVSRSIIKEIKKNYPDHNILTEYESLTGKQSDKTWLVTLDGIHNLFHGNSFITISMALVWKKETVLSVISIPFLGELYVAEKNKGAYLNSQKISVSRTRSFKKSTVICDLGDRKWKKLIQVNAPLFQKVKNLPRMGLPSLEIVSVAAGRADAYFVTGISFTEATAGMLILEEAGGKATDFKGKDLNHKKKNMVFSNGKIHDLMVENLEKLG